MTAVHPAPDRGGPPRAAARARERGPRGGGRGGPPTAGRSATRARRVRVAIVGATGYVGAELVRLLDRHPAFEIVGLVGPRPRRRAARRTHPHLARPASPRRRRSRRTADAVFLALPHGQAAAQLVPEHRRAAARRSSTSAPTSGSATPPTTRAGTASSTPDPELLERRRLRPAGAPPRRARRARRGATAAGDRRLARLLPDRDAPRARAARPAGLIGDLVVDAKSGVSGAGREPKADLHFGEVNESVKAYGVGGHRHVAEIEQELGRARRGRPALRTPTRARAASTSCPTSSR